MFICWGVKGKFKKIAYKLLSKTQNAQKYGIPQNSLSIFLKAQGKLLGAKTEMLKVHSLENIFDNQATRFEKGFAHIVLKEV